jgi:hypothetical protein
VIIIFIYSIVQLILHLVWLGGSIGHYVFMLAYIFSRTFSVLLDLNHITYSLLSLHH